MNQQLPILINPNFSISEIFSQSWHLTKGVKWSIWWFLLLSIVVITLVVVPLQIGSLILFKDLLTTTFQYSTPNVKLIILVIRSLIAQFIQQILVLFAMIVVTTLAIRQVLGLPVKVSLVLSQCLTHFPKIIGFLVIYLLILAVIFYLAIIPMLLPITLFFKIIIGIVAILLNSFFYITTFIFVIPFTLFNSSKFCQAIKNGIVLATKHFFKIFICSLLMALLIFVSLIPVGIGLIWTLPMSYVMLGLLYRKYSGN